MADIWNSVTGGKYMISFDTETTGTDLYHQARPFFVTSCDDEGEVRFWEWDVDPTTREPEILERDLIEIDELLGLEEEEGYRQDDIVLQNAKFDVTAMASVGGYGKVWPWDRTHDTLLAAHLLASNRPKDLTSLAIQYLGIDIQPYEDRLEKAVAECRRMVQQARLRIKRGKEEGAEDSIAGWKIAERDLEGMPSAKEKAWKYDTWLPRAMARHLGHPPDHPYWTVLSEYANMDSSVTVALWPVMAAEIRRRGLWAIYEERRRILPVAYAVEARGVTLNGNRLTELMEQYTKGSETAERVCVSIAAGYGYELNMPKGGNNKSLRDFCFGPLGLPAIKRSDKTGDPSLDKAVLEAYEAELPSSSKQGVFIRTLRAKRQRDTACQYMASYRRFWLPLTERDWYVLHPSLNPTGTDTTRWSSSNPNEQNISKKENFNLRYVFGPAPGREWWSLDYKNLELRLPAYRAGEEEMIALFERPDDPPYYGSTHLLNFSTVYPDIWEKELWEVGLEKVGPYCKKKYASTWYQYAKNGGFAVQYGAIDRGDGQGTADRAFHRKGAHALLKARFRKIDAFNQECIRFAEKHGYVETFPDRTVDPKRGYPLLCTRTEYGKILPTVPLNYVIQGTACQIMGGSMVRVHDFLQDLNRLDDRGYYIHMQVHDELDLDFPAGEGSEPWKTNLDYVMEVKRLMELGGEYVGVPTPVSVEYHASNWAEGRSIV